MSNTRKSTAWRYFPISMNAQSLIIGSLPGWKTHLTTYLIYIIWAYIFSVRDIRDTKLFSGSFVNIWIHWLSIFGSGHIWNYIGFRNKIVQFLTGSFSCYFQRRIIFGPSYCFRIFCNMTRGVFFVVEYIFVVE